MFHMEHNFNTMKIIIFVLILAFFVCLISCNVQAPKPQPPKREGKYSLTQTYFSSKIVGSITFYDDSHFYTNLSNSQKTYTYENISISQVECFEVGGNSHFTFTVMSSAKDSEKWQSVVNGTLLIWEMSK